MRRGRQTHQTCGKTTDAEGATLIIAEVVLYAVVFFDGGMVVANNSVVAQLIIGDTVRVSRKNWNERAGNQS